MKFLSNVFLFWLNARNKYEVLRNNEDKRDTSVNLDVWSLISLAYGTVIVVLSVWGAFACLEIMQNASSGGAVTDISYFIALVGVILCAILALVGVTSGLLNSLQYWIYQRKLNKRKIGLVAMILWFIGLAATVVGVILLVVL